MSPDEIKILVQKLNNGTSTPEEELALLKDLNNGVGALRDFVKEVALQVKENEK